MRHSLALLTAGCVVALVALPATDAPHHQGGPSATPEVPHASPIGGVRFERNDGQTDERVRFLHRGGGAVVFLTDDGSTTRLGDHAVRMHLEGACTAPSVRGETRLASYSNYFVGNDPARWRSNVPHYAAVRYDDVYPGIDLVYHGANGPLEYDFEVAPGADPGVIGLSFEGADMAVDRDGDLRLTVGDHEVRHRRPLVYQDGPAGRTEIDGRFELFGSGTARFRLAEYDRALALVIDPVVSFKTYLGGSDSEFAAAIDVDATGALYICGNSRSTDFPTQSPFQGTFVAGTDSYVSKLSADAGTLIYSTYLGGSGNDDARRIAVNAGGETYLAGYTLSTDFPTQSPFQATGGGSATGFVTRIAAGGASLTYSTYLGGSAADLATGLAIDAQGAAYVAGYTRSSNFPTQSAIQPTLAGDNDVFVTKLLPDGSALGYSTFLGGAGFDGDARLAVDAQGAAYVAGFTESDNFPVTPGAFQTTRSETGGAAEDVFVTKINPAGSALDYSTLLGGAGNERAFDIAVDTSGSAYVTGDAPSTFPVQNAFQGTSGGDDDAFVSKLAPDGASLVYSTFLGTASQERGRAIRVDTSGAAYVAGNNANGDFPTLDPIPNGGSSDRYAWVVKFDPAGASLPISSVIGAGSNGETAYGLAVDTLGNIHVAGSTRGIGPLTGSGFQTAFGGVGDAFIATVSPATGGTAIGEGTLYASRAAFKINHAQHAKGKDKDSFVIKGCVNPAGANADPTGATVVVSVNGMPVIPPTTLDARGRGKSDKGVSPAIRVLFKPGNGQFLAQVKKDDLTQELGDLNDTAIITETFTVSVTIANAGLLTDTVSGDLDFGTKSKQDKSSRGAYSFSKGVSQTAVYKATRTQVKETGDGHALSLRGSVSPDGGGAIAPDGDVTITVGDATPIVIPLASIRTSGSGAIAKYSYSRSLGEVTGLRKFTLDNRRKSITLSTDTLSGTGIPASGATEPTSHTLDVTIEIVTAGGTLTYGSTVELLRPRGTIGRWKR